MTSGRFCAEPAEQLFEQLLAGLPLTVGPNRQLIVLPRSERRQQMSAAATGLHRQHCRPSALRAVSAMAHPTAGRWR